MNLETEIINLKNIISNQATKINDLNSEIEKQKENIIKVNKHANNFIDSLLTNIILKILYPLNKYLEINFSFKTKKESQEENTSKFISINKNGLIENIKQDFDNFKTNIRTVSQFDLDKEIILNTNNILEDILTNENKLNMIDEFVSFLEKYSISENISSNSAIYSPNGGSCKKLFFNENISNCVTDARRSNNDNKMNSYDLDTLIKINEHVINFTKKVQNIKNIFEFFKLPEKQNSDYNSEELSKLIQETDYFQFLNEIKDFLLNIWNNINEKSKLTTIMTQIYKHIKENIKNKSKAMRELSNSKYILELDTKDYLILNYTNPLILINTRNIIEAYMDGKNIVIKLPYNFLKFKPENEIPIEILANNATKILSKEQFLTKFKTAKDGLKLSSYCALYSDKYFELAAGYSAVTKGSLFNLAEKNLDFNLQILTLNYKLENKNFSYHTMAPKNLTGYELNFKDDSTSFNVSSISWCYINENENICLLIYMPNLYLDSTQQNSVKRTEQLNIINSIINKYIARRGTVRKNILFSSETPPSESDNDAVTYEFIKMELQTFSSIQTLLNSALTFKLCYFTIDLYNRLIKWMIISFQCCIYLSNGHNVIIEDIDQISSSIIIGSLSKIMIEPNYCTFDGFIGLIRDDWINRAYFYNIKNKQTLRNRLNLFYAWLTCVQFLLFKFPAHFEFTFWLIHYITNNLWTKRFYPFCYSCVNGDIFEILTKNKAKFINIVYYPKIIPQIYYSIIEEIDPRKIEGNDYIEGFYYILLANYYAFYQTFNIELDSLKSINSDIQTLVYMWEGRIPKFITDSFFDPDAHNYTDQIALATKLKETISQDSTSQAQSSTSNQNLIGNSLPAPTDSHTPQISTFSTTIDNNTAENNPQK